MGHSSNLLQQQKVRTWLKSIWLFHRTILIPAA